VLIGALIAIFFSSAADLPGQGFVDRLNAFIEQSVTQPDRRKTLSSDVDDIETALEHFSKQLKKAAKRLIKTNEDHDTNRAAFETILDELSQERSDTQQKILELRFSIRDRISRKEWQKAFGRP
jgi:predicted  nucleic acid-binding Zn-ribbon protein